MAKKKPLNFLHTTKEDVNRVWRHIPGQGTDWVDDRSDHSTTESNTSIPSLAPYLDGSDETSNYSIPDQVIFKWGRIFDIVRPSSRRSCCFTRGTLATPALENFLYLPSPQGYTQLVQGSGSILQLNEALDVRLVSTLQFPSPILLVRPPLFSTSSLLPAPRAKPL